MTKRLRITAFAALLFSSSLVLFAATSKDANAFLLDPFEPIVLASLETIELIITSLSSDIGTMADRILVMADKIGEMSDRIVHTEELLIAASSNNVITSLIISPVEGTQVYTSIPVQISLSSGKTEYLLYMSNNADMSAATNALVQNGDTTTAWSRIADYVTGNKVYIAVKTVDATGSSDFSNTVMLNL